jgi:hypothetical protein
MALCKPDRLLGKQGSGPLRFLRYARPGMGTPRPPGVVRGPRSGRRAAGEGGGGGGRRGGRKGGKKGGNEGKDEGGLLAENEAGNAAGGNVGGGETKNDATNATTSAVSPLARNKWQNVKWTINPWKDALAMVVESTLFHPTVAKYALVETRDWNQQGCPPRIEIAMNWAFDEKNQQTLAVWQVRCHIQSRFI